MAKLLILIAILVVLCKASPTPAASATAFHTVVFDGIELHMAGSLLFVAAGCPALLLHCSD